MSAEVSLAAMLISSIKALQEACNDLKVACEEKAKLKTCDGKIHSVDVLVKDENNRSIGFQKQPDGTCKIITDSAGLTADQLKKQTKLVNRIKQRYAYNSIVQELKKQGYQIAEEKKVEKDSVKLVARRWVN